MNFYKMFHDLPWPFAILIVILVAQLFAWTILFISRKIRNDYLFSHNEKLLTMMISFVTLIFGIQVSFIIVLEQTWLNTGITATQEEAGALKNMFRDAKEFSREEQSEITQALLSYVRYVINVEWKEIESGRSPSSEADEHISQIWQAYKNLPITSEKEKLWYANALLDLDHFMQARTKRIVSSQSSLHPMLWTWILLLGLTALILISLLPIKKLSLDIFLLSLFTSIIGMVLYLTFALNHPFEGQVKVKPTAFSYLLSQFEEK